MEKLFLIHLGYYSDISDGVYESHTNVFLIASDFEDAKNKAKELDVVRSNKMHIDGVQMIESVKGYNILLELDKKLEGKDRILTNKFRELAPKPKN